MAASNGVSAPQGSIHDVHLVVQEEDDIWEHDVEYLLPNTFVVDDGPIDGDFHRLVREALHELCGTMASRK